MAQPTTLSFGDFVVKLGDGGSPETFAAPCGFVKESLKLSAQSSDTLVPDCDDPNAAAWTQSSVYGLSAEITGSGVLAMESLATWRAYFLSGASKNVQVLILPGASGGGYYQGAFVLTDFQSDVDRKSEGGRTQISVTMKSDGAVAWTDNA